MHRHPNISLWQREEDGSYKSDQDGWTLHVSWHPETKEEGKRRGFSWAAESSEGKKLEGEGVHEEIETAMSLAEDAVRRAEPS